jgi:hypothetical protein
VGHQSQPSSPSAEGKEDNNSKIKNRFHGNALFYLMNPGEHRPAIIMTPTFSISASAKGLVIKGKPVKICLLQVRSVDDDVKRSGMKT